ncbi:unnamed protein product [Sphenostylis stenocarpa]|uniref:Uncharacterized protein n=1 Tax=Sphenostylis stenocarpa TaxID=92480 RepID=A0AA86STK3_9FABA|nr:unnamed protein product [Sphenostylis stenocarpa]
MVEWLESKCVEDGEDYHFQSMMKHAMRVMIPFLLTSFLNHYPCMVPHLHFSSLVQERGKPAHCLRNTCMTTTGQGLLFVAGFIRHITAPDSFQNLRFIYASKEDD